jgi:hypothetical protein
MFRNRRRTTCVAALIVGLAMLAAPPPAEATFQIRISNDGGTTFNPAITDNGIGDLDPAVGAIFVNVGALSIRGFSTNFVSVGQTNFDLAVAGQAAAGTYDLVVQSSFDGINTAPPPQVLNYNFTGSATGPVGTLAATMRTFIDDANALFGTGAIVGDTGSLTVPNAGSLQFNASDPYSATAEIRLVGTITGNLSLSFDNNNSITPAPAPAAIALALSGIPALGVGAWIRRRRTPAVA